jgi:hypothetical protein
MKQAVSAAAKQLAFPFEAFEEELLNPLNGVPLTDEESFVASLLLDATSEKPMKTEEIIERVADALGVRLSFRQLKIVIRSLRRNHAFPILSRRSKPAGLWWCQSPDEMKEFARLWQSQYFDEMRTLYVMMKHNYPRLAGQMRFTDIPANEGR